MISPVIEAVSSAEALDPPRSQSPLGQGGVSVPQTVCTDAEQDAVDGKLDAKREPGRCVCGLAASFEISS